MPCLGRLVKPSEIIVVADAGPKIFLINVLSFYDCGNLSVAIDILEKAEHDMIKSGSVHYILVDIQEWLAHSYLINEQKYLAKKKFEECGKNLEELNHPCDNSRKTTVKNHLENLSNCLYEDGCDICLNLKEHNRQAKSQEEEEHLRNGMRRLSALESIAEFRFPQPESGCH
uniref:Uncharacterized protein n=1 Tax=Octopus bimaculoides TaxID=37653 RepID=A0A0L8G9R3_OCTBM